MPPEHPVHINNNRQKQSDELNKHICVAIRRKYTTFITPILTASEASQFLKTSKSTLQRLRKAKKGPPYFNLGRSVRYHRDGLEAWAKKQEDRFGQANATRRKTKNEDPLKGLF